MGVAERQATLSLIGRRLLPPSPEATAEIADALLHLQFLHLRSNIPLLYVVVAAITLLAGLAAQGDFPLVYQFVFPGLMITASLIRLITWRRRRNKQVPTAQVKKYLRSTFFTAALLSLVGAFWCTASYFETDETRRVLAPLFMSMSALACANCLASVPRIAIASLAFGLVPPVVAMLITDDLGIQSLALSIVVVSLLQMRLVMGKYAEMVNGLLLQSEMRTLADTDVLTGLHNRRAFTETFEREIVAQASGVGLSLAMLDLDGFKPANDRFGHAAGDAVLVEVAARLKVICGAALSVARIGGDEFAILFEAGLSEALVKERITALASILSMPYHFQDHMIGISASFGSARMPRDGVTASDLMLAADHVLYGQKAQLRAA
jgi:diguanylate cyclase